MGNSPNWVLLEYDIANFNLTDIIQITFKDEVDGNIYLFLWNYLQKFFGQTECTQSVIDGTTTPVGECWDYAFLMRPIWAVTISTILIFSVLASIGTLILSKYVIEISGLYT